MHRTCGCFKKRGRAGGRLAPPGAALRPSRLPRAAAALPGAMDAAAAAEGQGQGAATRGEPGNIPGKPHKLVNMSGCSGFLGGIFWDLF